jgi:hypothetical protein
MNRANKFNYIEEKLTYLATRIKVRGGLNILDLHIHSENFYLYLLNTLLGWELQNLNANNSNAQGIDLVDDLNRIVVQVSATASRQKILSSLSKDLSAYRGYRFIFLAMIDDASALRKAKAFANPHSLSFDPAHDIWDIRTFLQKHVLPASLQCLSEICTLLERELKSEPAIEKFQRNLTRVIEIISDEDWSQDLSSLAPQCPYLVDKKISHNSIESTRSLIEEHKIHWSRISNIYADFDKTGVNKSRSVFGNIRSVYLESENCRSSDQRLLATIRGTTRKVIDSSNYQSIAIDELEYYVTILVIHAFMECKIFENPEGYHHVGS